MDLWLLAQDAAPTGGGDAAAPGGDWTSMILLFGVIWLIFWLLVFRPQRAEQKKRQGMLDALKKGDKVRTSGGMLATVARVDGAEVLLKLSSDGKLQVRFARDGIAAVLTDPKGGDS